ncbi:MAG: hypothetical protein LBI59_00875 [Candidatus Accumulibacter sp.]|jgi:hypothetical protein|nr:hypothetical protein [Accumulibacter sp.]
MNAFDPELLGLLADPLDHEPLILSPDASRRPLSVLINTCIRAGFTLPGIEETGPDDPLSLPDMLALNAQKQ